VAEPSGCMMWFDPERELPYVGSPPPDSEVKTDPHYEGGALEGTSEEEEGVPLEGGDAKETVEDLDGLPF